MKNEILEAQPTTAELIASKQSEMLNIESKLKATDYIAMKELDGEDVRKYGDYKTERRKLRADYNALESEVVDLELKLKSENEESNTVF